MAFLFGFCGIGALLPEDGGEPRFRVDIFGAETLKPDCSARIANRFLVSKSRKRVGIEGNVEGIGVGNRVGPWWISLRSWIFGSGLVEEFSFS